MTHGCEWVVDASGCDPATLRSLPELEHLFADVVDALHLNPAAPALWHRFPEPGGITGMLLLQESHLTVHTFPEYGALSLNLFCCRPRPAWRFAEELRDRFHARHVEVRALERVSQ